MQLTFRTLLNLMIKLSEEATVEHLCSELYEVYEGNIKIKNDNLNKIVLEPDKDERKK